MYEAELPHVNDVVMARVKDAFDIGYNVTLLEYNNIAGMVLFSDISRKRVKSVAKLMQIGQDVVLMVTAVDEEKGYIDLSKKHVTPQDKLACEQRFADSKKVRSILHQVALQTNITLSELYPRFAWPLAHDHKSILAGFQHILTQPLRDVSVEEQIFNDVLQKRLCKGSVKLRARIDLICMEPEGIDAIKAALQAGLDSLGDEFDSKQARTIGAPTYIIDIQTQDVTRGIEALRTCTAVIKTEIDKRGGSISVTSDIFNPESESANDDINFTQKANAEDEYDLSKAYFHQ
jgi:translation initiation factor 2 subunit 1